MKLKKWIAPILTVSLLSMSFATGSAGTASAATTDKYSLEFNTTNYTTKTLTVDGQTVTYRAYENIVYVKNPVDINYEIMNVYIPEEYFQGKSIGNFTALSFSRTMLAGTCLLHHLLLNRAKEWEVREVQEQAMIR